MKPAFIRYLSYILLTAVGVIVVNIYYKFIYEGLDDGGAESSRSEIELFVFVTVLLVFKYIIYDYVYSRLAKTLKSREMSLIYLILGLIAASIDLLAVFFAYMPVTDSGFALIISVTITPLLLFAGVMMLLLALFLERKKGRASLKPTGGK